MHIKLFQFIGTNKRHFLNPVKKKLSAAHTKINMVWGIVIYDPHTKFELNHKHRLDTSKFLTI